MLSKRSSEVSVSGEIFKLLRGPPNPPVKVKFSSHVVGLDSFDSKLQVFSFVVGVKMSWTDPRLAESMDQFGVELDLNSDTELLEYIWFPNIMLQNFQIEPTIIDEFISWDNRSTGSVSRFLQIRGTCFAPFDLASFPFDSQVLPICFRVPRHMKQGVSSIETYDKSPNMRANCLKDREFHFQRINHVVEFKSDDPSNMKPEYVINIQVSRFPIYWLVSVMLPVFFITLFGFYALLCILPDAHKDRLSFLFLLLLPIFAIRFTVIGRLPNLPYLTLLDRWLFSCFLCQIAMALECIIVSFFAHQVWVRFIDYISSTVLFSFLMLSSYTCMRGKEKWKSSFLFSLLIGIGSLLFIFKPNFHDLSEL